MRTADESPDLIAISGMTPEQFAAQTARISADFEMLSEDDDTGPIVMRADYDNVRDALGHDSPELMALTNENRSVANALLYIANGARIFARFRSLGPDEVTISERASTEATLCFKVDRAAD